MKKLSEKKYYSEDFWFNSLHLHEENIEVNNYGKDYYGYKLIERVALKLNDIPEDGYIVFLGSHNCNTFSLLIEKYGKSRCIGIDIANPTSNSCVKVKNIMDFDESDDIPISFAYNDLGSFVHTPVAKWNAQVWAAKNVVQGGYFLGRNDFNTAKMPVESYMTRLGFINNNLLGIEGLLKTNLDFKTLEGHMLSKRCLPKFY